MEAVQIRQRGAEDFAAYYESLCALQDICPVASIRVGVKEGVLNCHVRRLKKEDWHPILAALKINKVLHTIVFFEKWEERLYPAIKNLATDDALRKFCSKQPVRVTSTSDKQTTLSIVRTIQDCLSVSLAVKSLALEGIPLTYKDCKCLSKGLLKNRTLSHLSMKGTGVGDRAVEVICNAVRDSHSLEWIDLTACGLTYQGASAVANVIKHQCLQRQSEAWKDSLRFHQPRLGQMPGLRRVTLNLNTELGDRGARLLSDTLRDDVCLKALDLQSCGVTTEGAKLFVEVLKVNPCLMVLDVRANELIVVSPDKIETCRWAWSGRGLQKHQRFKLHPIPHIKALSVLEACKADTCLVYAGENTDDDVIDVIHEQLMINVTGMDRSEESYVWLDVEVERIFHEIKLTQAPAPATKMRKCHKPTRTAKRGVLVQARRSYNSHVGPNRRGIPWRVAARSAQRWKIVRAPSVSVRPRFWSSEPTSNSSIPSNERASLKAELSTCYRRLRDEIRARAKAEAYIAELLEQNRQLCEQLKEMEEKATTCTPSSDDQMLEAVEATFKQFSAFLDLLHDKGLGELCALLPSNATSTKLTELDKT